VIITDTDHLWGVGGDPAWVWKSFTRGLNPIFMDPYQGQVLTVDDDAQRQQWESVRLAMGQTSWVASRMDLKSVKPRPELASTGYCLANPGVEYLVYLPSEAGLAPTASFLQRLAQPVRKIRSRFEREVSVDLSASRGTFAVDWFDPSTGEMKEGGRAEGGTRRWFTVPFAGDAVLILRVEQ
jgi:hypothetical protein